MKHVKVSATSLFAVGLLAAALAAPASADNMTACGAVMCLFGDATGHGGGSACNQYENPYYQIQMFTYGLFDPIKTIQARGNFLKECTSASSNDIQVANSNGGNQWGPSGPPNGGSGGGHGKPGNGGGGCHNDPHCVIP